MTDFLHSLQNAPPAYQIVYAAIGLIALTVIAVMAGMEGRHFRGLKLGSAWLKLRIASLLILAAAIAAILGTISAVGISGMEALAVAYLALITVGPLVYFGLHWLLGRMLGLSRGQSAWIGFSGLLMLGIIPAIGQTLMPYAQDLKQFLDERADNAIPVAPSPYKQHDARRFRLPNGAEVWAIHYQAPASLTLLRIDMETSYGRAKDVGAHSSSSLCHQGTDVHLFWPVDRPLPVLQLFWKDAGGTAFQSTWKAVAAGGSAVDFAIRWAEAALQLPVPLPRDGLSLIWERPDRSPIFDSLGDASSSGKCAPQTIELPDRHELGRPNLLRLRTDQAPPTGSSWADFRRPEADAKAPD